MKSVQYLIVLSFLILSCRQNKEGQANNNQPDSVSTTSLVDTSFKTVELKYADLSEKAFDIGSVAQLTDSCAFVFDCDCCAGELIFNKDSTFYYVDYCEGTTSVMDGKYLVEKNSVTLNYSGHYVSNEYNWERETDTLAVEYLTRDTVFEASSYKYYSEQCGERLKLTRENREVSAIAVDSKYFSSISELSNFIERLKMLK